jgi:hypothetical protein
MFPLRSQYIKVVVRGMPLCLAASSYDNRFSLRSKSSHFAWPPLPNAVWDGRLGQLAFESLSRMSEFIYVLENASMPGLVKIGRTERNVSERVSELSSHTGAHHRRADADDWELPVAADGFSPARGHDHQAD